MDDLDDLLGGPSNAAANKEIDDLLGGAPASPAPQGGGAGLGAFDDLDINLEDDDLLGGPAASSSAAPAAAAAAAPAAGAASPAPNRPDTRLSVKDNKFTPQAGGRRRATGTIKAQALTPKDAASPLLVPYIGDRPDVYYVRAVTIVDCSPANMNHASSARLEAPPVRTRAILTVSSTAVSLYAPSHWDMVKSWSMESKVPTPKPTREVPIDTIFGIITQSVVVPRMFGQNDVELQVLLQVREGADILIAMSRDTANDVPPSAPASAHECEAASILPTLSAVALSYGITLPISTLHKEGEMIEKMSNRHVGRRGDENLRFRQSEQLAYRTTLADERTQLKADIESMTVEVEKLKVSEIARTADQIQTDISEHEKAIAQFKKNLATSERSKAAITAEVKAVEAKMKAEAARRDAAAKDSMASAQHEAFKRQVAEFEQMKSAHKRDMDKLSTLIAFEEGRLKTRGGPDRTLFNGVLEISDRLEDLEHEDQFLSDQLSRCSANHTRQMEVLRVAKNEVLPGGRTQLQLLLDEIKMLQQLKERLDVDGDAAVKAQPALYTGVLSSVRREKPAPLQLPVIAAPEEPPAPEPAAPAAAAAAGAPKAPIALDDSDDDLPIVKPAAAAVVAPAPAPKPAIVLDDDEI